MDSQIFRQERRLGCLAGFLIPILAFVGVARAAEPREEAKAELVAGMSLLEKGDNKGALTRFEKAYALVPSPKIQFNMGLALQALERNVEALEAFDHFLDGATDVPREKREQANQHRRRLLSKVASITISSDMPGIDVSIDSTSRGKTPFGRPLYVDAGSHQLVAQKPGWSPVSQSFAASRGAELTIPIGLTAAQRIATVPPPPMRETPSHPATPATPATLSPLTPPPAMPVEAGPVARSSEPDTGIPTSLSRPWRRTAKWVSVGVAVAAVGVGILETMAAVRKSNDFNALPDNCMDDGNGHIRGGARCEQVNHDQTTATWMAAFGYGVGGAFAATALVLHLTERRETTASMSASVVCGASPTLWGASCVAHW